MASKVEVLKSLVLMLVMMIMAIFNKSAMAQTDCTNTIISMASCLSYIQGSASTPPSSCCTALANVVQTNPRCLCQVLNGGGSQYGITINVTRALQLPAACHVQTPPVSRCNEGLAPAPAPGPAINAGSKATPGSDSSSANSVTNTKINVIYLQVVGFFVLFVSSIVCLKI